MAECDNRDEGGSVSNGGDGRGVGVGRGWRSKGAGGGAGGNAAREQDDGGPRLRQLSRAWAQGAKPVRPDCDPLPRKSRAALAGSSRYA